MHRVLRGVFTAVVFASLPIQAHAQSSPDLVVGHWECTTSARGSEFYERITADYSADSAMAIKFYYVNGGGRLRMTMTLTGVWSVDPSTGVIDHNIMAARVDDMAVDGRPMTRAQHPSGEAGIAQQEEALVARHQGAALAVTTLDEHTLVLTDRANVTLDCAR